MTEKTFYNAVINDKEDVLHQFLSILHTLKTDYCVIGGLAVNAYAEPVVSLDMDIVIAFEQQERILEAIRNIFSADVYPHSINLTSKQSDIRIQIRTDRRYQEFISRASSKPVLGYEMKVASVEDVLSGKIWAYQDEARRKSKRQKDLADILRIVEAYPDMKSRLPQEVKSLI
jgi:hypothetical protein